MTLAFLAQCLCPWLLNVTRGVGGVLCDREITPGLVGPGCRHRTWTWRKGQNQDSNAYLVLAEFLMFFSNCQIKTRVEGGGPKEKGADSGQGYKKSNCHIRSARSLSSWRRPFSGVSAPHCCPGLYCIIRVLLLHNQLCHRSGKEKRCLVFNTEGSLDVPCDGT